MQSNEKKFPQKIGPWKFRDWAQIALFGPLGPGYPQGARYKCVVTMNPTQAGQSGAVGNRSAPQGPPRTSGLLELGGSIWAITVLDEQGIPLRWSGHSTSLYFKQKQFPQKWGRENLGIRPK